MQFNSTPHSKLPATVAPISSAKLRLCLLPAMEEKGSAASRVFLQVFRDFPNNFHHFAQKSEIISSVL